MKRAKWALAALGVMLLMAAFVPVGGSNTLLGQATRIGPARSWGMHYFWLDDRRILTFRPAGAGARAVEIEMPSGKETPLTGLSATMDGFEATGERHLSPDGKWLLWSAKEPGTNRPHIIASSLDGTKRKVWEMGLKTAWNHAGTEWVQFRTVRQKAVLRFRPIDPGPRREVTIPAIRTQPPQLPGNMAVLQGQFLGALQNGSYLLANTHALYYTQGKVYLFELNPDRPVDSMCRAVQFTGFVYLWAVRMSPDGRRLLWVNTGMKLPPRWIELAATFIPQVKPKWAKTLEIWTSYADGSNLRKLAGEEEWTDAHRFAEGVNWMPDSRRISFVRNNSLYILPADSR